MALYVIGDLHLSLGSEKPMDVFGGGWVNYVEKIREGLSILTERDTIVLCGDLSWGKNIEEAAPDFRFLAEFPGRKLLIKGNHDYWFVTALKLRKFLSSEGIDDIDILHNNCHLYENTALCGTRGWFYEEDYKNEGDEKVFKRELLRLEASLKCAGDAGADDILCFLHYPPICKSYKCQEILDILEKYRVKICCYGHLHGGGHGQGFEGGYKGVEYRLVSSDYIDFAPVRLMD